MTPFRLIPLVAALLATLPAHAQSLVDLYQAARAYDASFQSVQSQYEATAAKAEQARAGLLPTANLGMAISRSSVDPDTKLASTAFGSQSATLSGSHPLYRPANQTRSVVIALGFGSFLVTTLYLVQANLVKQFDITAAASRGNLVLFDIQDDQRAGVERIISDGK